MLPRIISPAEVTWPSGGSLYNEQIAARWAIDLEPMPGAWPTPSARALQQLTERLTSDPVEHRRPILLDGLIGCAAPQLLASARAAGVRVVLLVHLPLPAETGLSASRTTELASLEQQALTAASAVACTSHWAAADLHRRYGISAITVAEPGAAVAPPARGSDPPLLITPAAFSERKNHAHLLHVFGDALIADMEWSALWIGPEPVPGARRSLQRRVAQMGLAGRVGVHPAVTQPDLDALYARSDLLLLPSRAETYAMVVTEGFARGIPAIVSAGTGAAATLLASRDSRLEAQDPANAELLASGLPGSRFARSGLPGAALALNDPHAWAGALQTWLSDHSVRATWREAALARREDQPTWAQAAATLMQVMNPEVL